MWDMNFPMLKIIIFQRLRKVICRQILSAKSQFFFFSPFHSFKFATHNMSYANFSWGQRWGHAKYILPESSLCLGQHIIYLSVIFFRAGQVVKLLVASYWDNFFWAHPTVFLAFIHNSPFQQPSFIN